MVARRTKRARRNGRERLGTGELEGIVMDVLWCDGSWHAPADVQAAIADRHDVAYTTVMTVLVRLTQKRRVERRRDGRRYAYRATQSRDDFVAAQMRAALAPIDDRAKALSAFVEGLSAADRARLRRALGRRRARST